MDGFRPNSALQDPWPGTAWPGAASRVSSREAKRGVSRSAATVTVE